MTDPKPLTREELDAMSNMRANLWPFGWGSRVIAMARRCIELEAKQNEREKLERRRDEWLSGREWRNAPHSIPNGVHTVFLTSAGSPRSLKGTGADYHEALRAALDKLEKTNG